MQTYSRLEKIFRSLAKENINTWGKENLYHSELLLPLPIATSSGNLLWLCYGCVLLQEEKGI